MLLFGIDSFGSCFSTYRSPVGDDSPKAFPLTVRYSCLGAVAFTVAVGLGVDEFPFEGMVEEPSFGVAQGPLYVLYHLCLYVLVPMSYNIWVHLEACRSFVVHALNGIAACVVLCQEQPYSISAYSGFLRLLFVSVGEVYYIASGVWASHGFYV